MIASPLERRRLANLPDRVVCGDCWGSGVDGNGSECDSCIGSGSIKDGFIAQHSSATVEHYTPAPIVEAARTVLGGIDLDPASCELAQDTVKAIAWYGPGSELGEEGLAEPWMGRVFCNPPGGLVPDGFKGLGTKSNAALWWGRLASSWQSGEVEVAIFVGFTLEILRSTQGLDVPQPLDFPLCVPSSRIAFDTNNRIVEKTEDKKKILELIDPTKPEGVRVPSSSPTHANVIVWLPPTKDRSSGLPRGFDADLFCEAFELIGGCRI